MRRAGLLTIAALICGITTAAPNAANARGDCPQVTVACPGVIVPVGVPITFSATVGGADPAVTYTFRWTVSAGTITSGQNTPSITVDTTGLGGMPVEATVEVGGFPEPCDKKASCSSQLAYNCIFPKKLDEYGALSPEDERARLDNFAAELKNDPEAVGYIVSYAGRRARVNEAQAWAARAKSYLTSMRDIGEGRVVIIDGGHREDRTIELWVLPEDASPPTPAPTVDPSEVITIKGAGTRRPAKRQ
jgi:hypothetical protein